VSFVYRLHFFHIRPWITHYWTVPAPSSSIHDKDRKSSTNDATRLRPTCSLTGAGSSYSVLLNWFIYYPPSALSCLSLCSWLANQEKALESAGGKFFAGGKVRFAPPQIVLAVLADSSFELVRHAPRGPIGLMSSQAFVPAVSQGSWARMVHFEAFSLHIRFHVRRKRTLYILKTPIGPRGVFLDSWVTSEIRDSDHTRAANQMSACPSYFFRSWLTYISSSIASHFSPHDPGLSFVFDSCPSATSPSSPA